MNPYVFEKINRAPPEKLKILKAHFTRFRRTENNTYEFTI